MRINLTSMEENKMIDEITKIIEQAFSKTNYKFKIISCNYEANIEKIKQYHKSYYMKNKDKIRKYHQDYNKKKKSDKSNNAKQVEESKTNDKIENLKDDKSKLKTTKTN